MKSEGKVDGKNKVNFRILMSGAILLTILCLIGQTMAVISYDVAVSLGLQESAGEITAIGVAFNRGFGVGDTLVYIPLLLLGIAGMLKRKFWGLLSMAGALAITAYWPIVALAALFFARNAPAFKFSNYTLYSVFLFPVFIYGLWGLFYLYNNRKALVDE